jgi:hypothetical protein
MSIFSYFWSPHKALSLHFSFWLEPDSPLIQNI